MKLTVKDVLVEYDGPEVIEATDPIGGHYIGVSVSKTQPEFVLAGVSPERLRRFRLGREDLRSLLVRPDAGPFQGFWDGSILDASQVDALPEKFLPREGFLLRAERTNSDEVVREAQIRNALVMEITLEPEEVARGNRIHADTLSVLLLRIQNLVKHAFAFALRGASPAVRRTIDSGHWLDVVVPAAPGSFKVVLEAAARPKGMFGHVDMDRGLEVIDRLMQDIDSPEKAIEVVRNYKGHLAGAFQKLLEVVDTLDVPLSYAWARPSSDTASAHRIGKIEAAAMVQAMKAIAGLTTETKRYTGFLNVFDEPGLRWGIMQTNGQEIRGRVREESVPLLKGLISGRMYEAECAEELETTEWGKESKTLYLQKITLFDESLEDAEAPSVQLSAA